MNSQIFLRRSTNVLRALPRFYSEGSQSQSPQSPSKPSPPTPPPQAANYNVPGLSSACVEPATSPVGPGVDPNKSGAYKVPEYFCYNNMSYFEAEIEMAQFRCPQPSALKK